MQKRAIKPARRSRLIIEVVKPTMPRGMIGVGCGAVCGGTIQDDLQDAIQVQVGPVGGGTTGGIGR